METAEIFRMVFPNAKYATKVFEAITAVAEEVDLRVWQYMARVRQMDAAHVTMVCLEIVPKRLVEYQVAKEIAVPISVQNLVDLLKRAGVTKNEDLEISYDDEKLIVFSGTMVFEIPKLSWEPGPEINEPRVNMTAEFVIDVKELYRIVRTVGSRTDMIAFTMRNDALMIEGRGEAASMSFRPDVTVLTRTIGETRAMYNIIYFERLVKALKTLTDTVAISFATDKPMKLTAPINYGELSYLIAPRVMP